MVEETEEKQVTSPEPEPERNVLQIGRIYVEFDRDITPKDIQLVHLTLIAYMHAENVVDEMGRTNFGHQNHRLNNPLDEDNHYG